MRPWTSLDLRLLNGEALEPAEDTEEAQLLQDLGEAHEHAHLNLLREQGHEIAVVDKDRLTFEQSRSRTFEPVPARALCRWRDHCARQWDEEESTWLVAGITRLRGGVESPGPGGRRARLPGLLAAAQSRLRMQPSITLRLRRGTGSAMLAEASARFPLETENILASNLRGSALARPCGQCS